MRRNFVPLLGVAVAICAVSHAGAAILYDNLGSSPNLYDGTRGWSVSGPLSGLGVYVETAQTFTPSTSAIFSELDIALTSYSGTNSVIVELLNDSGGLPGGVLQSWSITGLPAIDSCCTLQTLMATGSTPLVSGTPYWVAVLPGAGDTLAEWNEVNDTPLGTVYQYANGAWNGYVGLRLGAYEVQGTAGPEPAMLLPCAVVLLGLFARLRKR